MSKIRCVFYTLLMIIIFILIIVNVSYAETAEVITETLKVRKEPNTNCAVLGLLSVGDEIEVIEKEGDWYKIEFENSTGYVHMDYVKVEGTVSENNNIIVSSNNTQSGNIVENNVIQNITETNTINNVESNVTVTNTNSDNEIVDEDQTAVINQERTGYVKTDSKLYILPLISSSQISDLNASSKVIIIGETNKWYYIQADTISGWVIKENIEENINQPIEVNNNENELNEEVVDENTVTQENPNPEENYQERKAYISGSSVYLRTGSSTDSPVYTSLNLNDEITIIGEEGDWYKVKIDGDTVYVSKSFVSDTKKETTSRGNVNRNEDIEESTVQVSTIGEQIVDEAKKYLGCKYVYGGSGPSTFDCSGFTMYVYEKFGKLLSHSARAQSKMGTYVSKSELQPGDLVFFKDYPSMQGIGHCGIYIGDRNFIHASSGSGYCVKISTLLSGSYLNRYETARRLF